MSFLINPYRYAAAPSGPTSTQWRMYINQAFVTSGTGITVLYEIEMRGTIGGANQCSGGSASASSSNGGNVPANAFDGNTGTAWQSSGLNPQWIQYTFPSAVTVAEISAKNGSGADIPAWFDVQYWDGGAWVTYYTAFVETWANNTTKTFAYNTVYLGSEIVGDPGFDDPGYWSASGGWSISGSNLVGASASDRLEKTGLLTSGHTYFISMPYNKTAGSKLRIATQTSSRWVSDTLGSSGTLQAVFTANNTSFRLEADSAVFSGTMPSISIKRCLG